MDPDDFGISADATLTRELEWRMKNDLERLLEEREESDANQQLIARNNRMTVRDLMNQVEATGHGEIFTELSNPAQNARLAAGRITAGGKEIVERRLSWANESIVVAKLDALLAQVEREDSVVSEAINRPTSNCDKWMQGAIMLIVGGFATYLILEMLKINQSERRSMATSNDEERALGSNQTFLSLAMEATTNQPLNATAFGVTPETFGQLRQAFLADRDNMSEDQYWSLQADKSTIIFPPTQKHLSLGDHMLALDFQFELLNPLYDSQPLDLDVDATISALANAIDLSADCPMSHLYNGVMDLVPEASGANRLQRITLVRSGIARAINQSLAT